MTREWLSLGGSPLMFLRFSYSRLLRIQLTLTSIATICESACYNSVMGPTGSGKSTVRFISHRGVFSGSIADCLEN